MGLLRRGLFHTRNVTSYKKDRGNCTLVLNSINRLWLHVASYTMCNNLKIKKDSTSVSGPMFTVVKQDIVKTRVMVPTRTM